MKEQILLKLTAQNPRRLLMVGMVLTLLLLSTVDPAFAQHKCPPEYSEC